MPKAKKREAAAEVSETERMNAAKKIVQHLFGGGSVTETVRVFRLIAPDAEEEDLIALTAELVAVKSGLGEGCTFAQVLGVHHALVEDITGMMLENADEIDEEIAAAREVLAEAFDEAEATKPENLAAFLGA